MATIAQLFVELSLRSENFNNGLRQAQREAKEFEKTMRPTTKLLDDIGTSLTNVGAITSVAVTAPLVAFGATAVKAFNESENASALLENAIRSTGGAAGKTADELKQFAAELQKTSIFGDDQIIQKVQTQLLTFTNIAGSTFDRATRAALDMSTVLGQDLQSSAIQLGKALNDPIAGVSALQRVGVKLSESQKQLVKSFMEVGDIASAQAVILDELKTEFGGAAEAAAKAGSGPMAVLANKIDDLNESFGKLISKALVPLIAILTKVIDWLNSLDDSTKTVILVVGALAAAIGPVLLVLGSMALSVSSLITVYGQLAPILTGVVIPAITSFGSSLAAIVIANGPLLLAVAAIGGLIIALEQLGEAWINARKAQQEAAEATKNAEASAERAAKAIKDKWGVEVKKGTMTTQEWEQAIAEAARTAAWFDKQTQNVANAHKAAADAGKSSKQAHDALGNSIKTTGNATKDLTVLTHEQTQAWIKQRTEMYQVELAIRRINNAFDEAAPTMPSPLPSEIPILNPGQVPGLPGLPRVGTPPIFGPTTQASTEVWDRWQREGQQAIDQVVDDISDMFVQGIIHGKSFWESFKRIGQNAITSIVDTLLSKMLHAFLDPFSTAVGKLLEGMTSSLTGFLSGFGSKLAGIFGSGGAGGAISSIGGGGGAGGALGGLGGGGLLSGVIGGGISAAGSLLGSMRLEGTMNAVEYNTRVARIHLGVMIDQLFWPWDGLFHFIAEQQGEHSNQLDAIYNLLNSKLGGGGAGGQNITINMPVTTSGDPVEFAARVRDVLNSALKTDRDGLRTNITLAASQNQGLASSLPA